MGSLEYFTLGRRNLKCENHWEELASYYYRITKPTVLCFGGTGTIDSRDANAMCKIAQGLVGLKLPSTQGEFATSDDVDFVGVGYGLNEKNGKRIGELTDAERDNLVRNMFLPLCTNEKGDIMPKQQIVKNFNQITFFAHCYGAYEISTLVGSTYREMIKLGIEDETVNEALDQMFAVAYAPYTKCACPSLQVIPMLDFALESGAKDSEISTQFLNNRLNTRDLTDGTVAYKEDEYTASVLVSRLIKNSTNEHPVSLISRNEDWEFLEERADYGDEVSQVMGYALASSVANSIQNQNSESFIPKPSVDEVLEDAKDILGETKNDDFETTIELIKLGKLPQQNEDDKAIDEKLDADSQVISTNVNVFAPENEQ